MTKEERPGFWQDQDGEWQVDRRQLDRRTTPKGPMKHDKRRLYRRHEDQMLMQEDHKAQIEEALEEFAEEHQKPS